MKLPVVFLMMTGGLCAQGQDPPLRIPDTVAVQRDVVYATLGDRALHLDLFLPKAGAGPFPVVVYIHGGAWRGGSKAAFERQAAHMATRGFAGACIEYRLSGEARYPAAVHDSKAAVRWVRANAPRFRLNPRRVGVAGGSAGGHLVALLGTTGDDPTYEGTVGVTGQSTAVQAVAAFNPVLDMVILGKLALAAAAVPIANFLGKPFDGARSLWEEASPFYQADAKSAPTLFLHGTADTTVPYAQSVTMREKLKKAGVRAELFTAEGAGHGFFNRPPWFQPTLEAMEKFFTGILKDAARP